MLSVWIPYRTPALVYAEAVLSRNGICAAEQNADLILLSVPFRDSVPKGLPKGVPVFGGMLKITDFPENPVTDLLNDETYLCRNAAVTSRCAVRLLGQRLPVTLSGCSVLIAGFGRIGKFLLRDLTALGADCTVCLRNPATASFLTACGISAMTVNQAADRLSGFRAVLNTVPALIFPETGTCPDTVLLDLASVPGMEGPNVISARGLPGKMVPETSGTLIAKTVLDHIFHKEVSA